MAEEKKVKAPKVKPVKPAKVKQQKHKKMKTYQQRQDRSGYAFLSPWIVGFAIFTLFPFVMTIYLSFTNVRQTIKGYEIDWIGFDNYYTAFFQNESFLPAMIAKNDNSLYIYRCSIGIYYCLSIK